VSRIETRLTEAIHMGFKRCVLPKKNLKGLSSHFSDKVELIGIELVDEAIQKILH
jgi:DNA repair protein RadA/Sms